MKATLLGWSRGGCCWGWGTGQESGPDFLKLLLLSISPTPVEVLCVSRCDVCWGKRRGIGRLEKELKVLGMLHTVSLKDQRIGNEVLSDFFKRAFLSLEIYEKFSAAALDIDTNNKLNYS